VDASAPEATLEAGILKTDLKIVDWADATSQHDEIISAHRDMLKSRGIKGVEEKTEKKDSKKSVAPTVAKKESQKKRKPNEVPPLSAKPEPPAKLEPNKKKRKKTAPAKVVEQPKQSKEAQVTPVAADGNVESTRKPKKKKRFLEKNEMSAMLGEIVKAAESKSDVRLHRDETESSHLDVVIQSKKEKQENRKKRKQEARAILTKAVKRKSKNKNKGPPNSDKKVMFA